MSGSGLYVGKVTHRRFRPKAHALSYRIFQIVVDLADLEALDRRLRLFSYNRRNLIGIDDRDHGVGEGGSIRGFVTSALARAGIDLGEGRILMQTMPRVLGFVFNPLTVFYCHRPDGGLAAVIYQVHNTFGERHAYVAPCEETVGGRLRQTCAKAFHVSPFMPMTMTYAFVVEPPTASVVTVVNGLDAASGDRVIHAAFIGERRDLNDRELLRVLLGFPFMTLGVVAAIHFEALKLALKGLRLLPAPPHPPSAITVAR